MVNWQEKFDGCAKGEEAFTEEDVARIPAKRGVVLLASSDGRPIVMLTAADMRGRVRNRLRHPDQTERRSLPNLHRLARQVFWKFTTGHFETDLWFLELAREIWPGRYESLVDWKPAWFVHVDVDREYPHFVRTREVFAEAGRYFGPFDSARSADRFIDGLQDAFDLCRDYRWLRRSPNATRCSYGQMGRCLSPCDGTIGMKEYGEAVARAADFAGGCRRELRDAIIRRMKEAAAALRYEQAARAKARLERLAEFDKPCYAFVAPAERFRFLLVQPGQSARSAKVFMVDRGRISPGEPVAYPLRLPQLEKILAEMTGFVRCGAGESELDRLRMGLVTRYLFSSPSRRGVILRWDDSLTAVSLAEAIENAKDLLRLKAPKAGSKERDIGSK